MKCDECGNVHPEDSLVESYGFTWEQIKEFADKKEWALSSKLAMLLIEIGDECSHAYDRAEFFKQFAPKVKT